MENIACKRIMEGNILKKELLNRYWSNGFKNPSAQGDQEHRWGSLLLNDYNIQAFNSAEIIVAV